MTRDKQIEQNRYNDFSVDFLNSVDGNKDLITELNASNSPSYLQQPYIEYHDLISQHTSPGKKQLDLCCGNGIHSFTGARNGAKVIALDYAEKSIEVCLRRSKILGIEVDFRCADVQTLLDFENEQFDLVTCAGSLSYLDHEIFFKEIYRVLKKGGKFICVDSLNHNPVYRINRFIHYLMGRRTMMTLKRMPKNTTIQLVEEIFSNLDTKYFGIFLFLSPILSPFMSSDRLNKILKGMDQSMHFLKSNSFKIVFCATK